MVNSRIENLIFKQNISVPKKRTDVSLYRVKFRQRTPAHFYVFIKIDKTDKDLTSRNGAGRISSQTRILPRFSGFKSNNNKQEKNAGSRCFCTLVRALSNRSHNLDKKTCRRRRLAWYRNWFLILLYPYIQLSNLIWRCLIKNMLKLLLSKNLKRVPKKIAWGSTVFLTNEWLPKHAALKSLL